MGRAGIETAAQYTIEAVAGRFADLYEALVADPSATVTGAPMYPAYNRRRHVGDEGLYSRGTRAFYVESGTESAFAVLHPASGPARDTAVLVCPPFGWEETCSRRPLRDWAEDLALAGYPTLRLTLPSTGDSSGSPRDSGIVPAWTQAIAAAARSLLTELPVCRVTGIGVGLGGLLTVAAVSEGAPIDDMVLWAVPARGRAVVREMKAFAELNATLIGSVEPDPDAVPDGSVQAGGFLLTPETVAGLEQMRLDRLTLPARDGRRALLLDRDGIAPSEVLEALLARSEVEVQSAPGPGYSEMLAEPHHARAPVTVFATARTWLDATSQPAPAAVTAAFASASESLQLPDGVSERPFSLAKPFGRLTGVLAEPTDGGSGDLCAVLLNAAAIYHAGPNRMWVEAARRWAQQGIAVLRLDLAGIGDADGEFDVSVSWADMFLPGYTDEIRAALDALAEAGLGRRFLLGGLCTGAYWALHAAASDPRVQEAVMINPRLLVWDPEVVEQRPIAPGGIRLSYWRKINAGSARRAMQSWIWSARAARRAAAARATRRLSGGDELDQLFDGVRSHSAHATLVFGEDEPLRDELVRTGHLARLTEADHATLVELPVRDHTIRPVWAQQQAHAILDRALERTLAVRATAVAG